MTESKNILITGATSGIGLATAHLLGKKGHRLGCFGRNADVLQKLQTYGMRYNCDLRDVEAVRRSVAQFVEASGSIDVLINNAGGGVFNPLVEATLDEWHDMVDINIKGALTMIHTCLPHLIKSRGHIIQLGSLGGHHVFPNSGVYCATKHALHAISESLRLELSDTISVTTISPGPVDTAFITASTNPDMVSHYQSYFATGLRPETIAKQISYAIDHNDTMTISEIVLRPKRLEH